MSEDVNAAAVNTTKRTRVPLLSAFFMIYIFVSGGSFGIEEMVASGRESREDGRARPIAAMRDKTPTGLENDSRHREMA